jgi:hypothetical protein
LNGAHKELFFGNMRSEDLEALKRLVQRSTEIVEESQLLLSDLARTLQKSETISDLIGKEQRRSALAQGKNPARPNTF